MGRVERKILRLYSLHSDHLNSTLKTTNSNGGNVAARTYTAYGKVRSSSGDLKTAPWGHPTFTGQKEDSTGLMYFNARYYDPQLGTFLSPDTVVPDAGAVVADYNRFAYTRSNPLKFSDPTGHRPCGKTCEGDSTDWRMAAEDSLAKGSREKSTDLADVLANALTQIDMENLPVSVTFDDLGEPQVNFDADALRKIIVSPLSRCAERIDGVCGISVGFAYNQLGGGIRGSIDLFVDPAGDLAVLLTGGGGGYTPWVGPPARFTATGIPNATLVDVDGTFGQFGGSAARGSFGGFGEAVFGTSDTGQSLRGQTYGHAYTPIGVAGEIHMSVTYSVLIYKSWE